MQQRSETGKRSTCSAALLRSLIEVAQVVPSTDVAGAMPGHRDPLGTQGQGRTA